ncbi:hypothetical protein HMPREF9607_02583 [Cutibacterium modestum HL044PA1]|uniref:Uncharacterized protein n=1 Tax=Cutibacterium modestum HL044PA1 TaxID=765109 RepID=A0ABP2K3F7_9ACTN|nr:hypothetical protein HMPREF9607_02583 [Cutibacterium modestum HL044PA1]
MVTNIEDARAWDKHVVLTHIRLGIGVAVVRTLATVLAVTLTATARPSPAIAVFREPTVLVVGIGRSVVDAVILSATV